MFDIKNMNKNQTLRISPLASRIKSLLSTNNNTTSKKQTAVPVNTQSSSNLTTPVTKQNAAVMDQAAPTQANNNGISAQQTENDPQKKQVLYRINKPSNPINNNDGISKKQTAVPVNTQSSSNLTTPVTKQNAAVMEQATPTQANNNEILEKQTKNPYYCRKVLNIVAFPATTKSNNNIKTQENPSPADKVKDDPNANSNSVKVLTSKMPIIHSINKSPTNLEKVFGNNKIKILNIKVRSDKIPLKHHHKNVSFDKTLDGGNVFALQSNPTDMCSIDITRVDACNVSFGVPKEGNPQPSESAIKNSFGVEQAFFENDSFGVPKEGNLQPSKSGAIKNNSFGVPKEDNLQPSESTIKTNSLGVSKEDNLQPSEKAIKANSFGVSKAKRPPIYICNKLPQAFQTSSRIRKCTGEIQQR